MAIFLVVALLVAILAVVFALLNTAAVTVNLFFVTFESSLALILLLAFSLGILMGILVMMPRIIRNRVTISGQKRKLHQLEKTHREVEESGLLPAPSTTPDPGPTLIK